MAWPSNCENLRSTFSSCILSLEETIMQRSFWDETEMAILWMEVVRTSSVRKCEFFIGINIEGNGIRIK